MCRGKLGFWFGGEGERIKKKKRLRHELLGRSERRQVPRAQRFWRLEEKDPEVESSGALPAWAGRVGKLYEGEEATLRKC